MLASAMLQNGGRGNHGEDVQRSVEEERGLEVETVWTLMGVMFVQGRNHREIQSLAMPKNVQMVAAILNHLEVGRVMITSLQVK